MKWQVKSLKLTLHRANSLEKDDPIIYLDSEVERANLKAAQGRFPAVESNYKRMSSLFKKGSVSQGQVDDAEADYLALQGEIESPMKRRFVYVLFEHLLLVLPVYVMYF